MSSHEVFHPVNATELADAEQQLASVYEEESLRRFRRLASLHKGKPVDTLLARFAEMPTSQYTQWCREENLEWIAHTVLPTFTASQVSGEPLRIGLVGCANGQEVYTLRFYMLLHQSPEAKVTGFDVAPGAIAEAELGVYRLRVRDMSNLYLDRSVGKPPLFAGGFFIDTGKREWSYGGRREMIVSVAQEVREGVAFVQHDLLTAPVAQQDVVVCNNMLRHFQNSARELLFAHLVESVPVGGMVLLEDQRRFHTDINPDTEALLRAYYAWQETLVDRYPVKQIGDHETYFQRIG